jgi:hypothetical protein
VPRPATERIQVTEKMEEEKLQKTLAKVATDTWAGFCNKKSQTSCQKLDSGCVWRWSGTVTHVFLSKKG